MRGALAIVCVAMAFVVAPIAATAATEGRSLNPTAGQQFTDVVGSFDGPNATYSAAIDWGDGSTSTGTVAKRSPGELASTFDVNGTHTYAVPGDFKIVVTITAQGFNDTITIESSAHVAAPQQPPPGQQPPPEPEPRPQNSPPTAVFVAETTTPRAGTRIAFDASASHDSDGKVISYAWDLDGNGSYETDCGSSPSAAGSYGTKSSVRVGLLVTDSAGATSTTSTLLSIGSRTSSPPKTGSAPGGLTLGWCRPEELATRPGLELGGDSCLRTVAARIAEAVSAGCFAEDNEEPKASSAALPPKLDTRIVEQHYYSTGSSLKLNGLDIRPSSGTKLVIHKEKARLYTLGGGAKVSLNAGVLGIPAIPLKNGSLSWLFPIKGNKLRIASFDVAPAAGLFGFKLDGTAAVDLTSGTGGGPRAEVPVHLGLPGVFSDPTTGQAVTADITLKADNKRKLYLDALRVDVPRAFLGGLQINNLFFEYRSEESIWRGGAELLFPSGHKLDALPPPPTQGVGFRNGGLEYAGAELTFPDPGVPVFSSVYLHRIGFTIETHPTRFTGTVNLTAGSAAGKTLASIDGSVLVAFATPSEPLTVRGKKAEGLAIDVAGSLTLVGTVPLAEAHVTYLYPYYIEAGGKFEYQVIKDRLFARATAGGWVDMGSGRFNIEAGADLCIDIKVYSGCRGGSVVLSSRGMAGCVSLWFANVGGGIYWSGGGRIYFSSCDVGDFRATLSRAAADGTFGVTVGRDAPFEAIEVTGRDTAPNVELTGPGGERVSTPAEGFLNAAGAIIWRGSGEDRATWVLLPRSQAGRWTIAPAEGSQIERVRAAHGLPEPKIAAMVSGKGRKRTLAYDVRQVPGQTVRFFERGRATAHQIGRASSSRGKLPFRLAEGPGGPRTIVAQVENNGLVRKSITVARFTAPKPGKPGKPRGLKVKRTRLGLLITWRRVAGVNRYVVGLDVSDGRRLALPARRTALRVKGIPATAGARVRVAGLTVTNTAGRKATARVRPVKRRRPSA